MSVWVSSGTEIDVHYYRKGSKIKYLCIQGYIYIASIHNTHSIGAEKIKMKGLYWVNQKIWVCVGWMSPFAIICVRVRLTSVSATLDDNLSLRRRREITDYDAINNNKNQNEGVGEKG